MTTVVAWLHHYMSLEGSGLNYLCGVNPLLQQIKMQVEEKKSDEYA